MFTCTLDALFLYSCTPPPPQQKQFWEYHLSFILIIIFLFFQVCYFVAVPCPKSKSSAISFTWKPSLLLAIIYLDVYIFYHDFCVSLFDEIFSHSNVGFMPKLTILLFPSETNYCWILQCTHYCLSTKLIQINVSNCDDWPEAEFVEWFFSKVIYNVCCS